VDGAYAGVTEQAGIHASDGRFNLNVKGNPDLEGAVIGICGGLICRRLL
jgi:filamentous hemagglutinin